MKLEDHSHVFALMRSVPGVRLREADSLAGTAAYLARNPGMSYVAEISGELVGCLFAGHDGRRGYLQHLVVALKARRLGIGRALVAHCLEALAREGIEKTHVDVLADNHLGLLYWEKLGWLRRDDLVRYSITPMDKPEA